MTSLGKWTIFSGYHIHTSLVCPFSVGDWPTVICRKYRSFVSMTLFQVIVVGSMFSRLKREISSLVRSLGSLNQTTKYTYLSNTFTYVSG